MIDKIEEIYIKEMSILENYRGKFVASILLLSFFIIIVSLLKWFVVLNILIALLIFSCLYFIIVKINDFLKLKKKQHKGKLIYSLREYQKAKFMNIKVSIQELLKNEKCYNLKTIESLINTYSIKYEKERKNDKSENYKWIISIVVSMVVLNVNQQKIVIAILMFIGLSIFVEKFLDRVFEYILASKVNYNWIYDALVEIKLEMLNKKVEK